MHTYRFESDPKKQLLFDLPIVYSETEGSQAYTTSLGIGMRFPITNNWSLTPGVRFDAVGSFDMGSAAVIYSGSIISNYNFYWNDYIFSLGNMMAYYKTQSININDYETDYDLQNTMTKHGIGVEGPMNFEIMEKPTSWQFDIAYPLFGGDELYIDDYFDFALSFGTRATGSSWDYLRVGLGYTYCEEYNGAQINPGNSF